MPCLAGWGALTGLKLWEQVQGVCAARQKSPEQHQHSRDRKGRDGEGMCEGEGAAFRMGCPKGHRKHCFQGEKGQERQGLYPVSSSKEPVTGQAL